MLLRVSALRRQLGLLPLVGLRALLVLLLETLEVPPQGGLARNVEDGADGERRRIKKQSYGSVTAACGPVTLPGLSVISTVLIFLIAATVLVLCLLWKKTVESKKNSHFPVSYHVTFSPFSPRFLRVRSMWSLSWIRTCRSVGWSLMNECLSSCSVDGRLGYVFTRQPSMKSMNFLDLEQTRGRMTHEEERSERRKRRQLAAGALNMPTHDSLIHYQSRRVSTKVGLGRLTRRLATSIIGFHLQPPLNN